MTSRAAPHAKRNGMSRERAAIIAIILVLVGVYFGFTKDIPFTKGYRVNVYLKNAANVKPNAPVRIAGVTVGKVIEVTADEGSPTTKLVLQFDKKGLPIHKDATAKLRPRIFLEGNFFVDLDPGSPSAPELEDGGSLPVSQTAGPVQFDQLLSTLNKDTRTGFQVGLREFAGELYRRPSVTEQAAADPPHDPDVAGKTAFEALNGSLRYAPDAIRGGSRILRALGGEEPDDIKNILKGLRDFSAGVNERETQVISQIRAFDTTIGAFADNEENLQAATREFSRLAIRSLPAAKAINELLPQITTFSSLLAPQIGELPATIDAAGPWITQTTELFDEDELGKTASLSKSVISHFAGVTANAPSTIQQIGRISACWNNVFYPALIQQIDDAPHSTGVENYKEFWYSLVGMASESQLFDGNGNVLRLGGGGDSAISTSNADPNKVLKGSAPRAQSGVRPKLPAKDPEIRGSVPCYQNAPPNVNKLGTP